MNNLFPDLFRVMVIVGGFIEIGLCLSTYRFAEVMAIKLRVIGLALICAGAITTQIQRWDESFPLSIFFVLPGLIIAGLGLYKVRPGESPHDGSKPYEPS